LLFNSLIFTLFLPIVFTLYWITPARLRNYLLLFASYYFYFSYNPWFLLLLIGTSVLDYWCAREITAADKQSKKKIFLLTSLISNIGILFIFKYFVLFHNTSIYIFNLNQNVLNNFIIPAGLSFYTFQSLSYTLDVYRGKYKANDKLSDFLLFVSFFPHMVAGPIVRFNSLMPQLTARSYFKNINWTSFATLTTWGYFKKLVIADNLNLIVTPVFNDVNAYSGIELLSAGFLFVVQVYCDFSGYSDIATGISKLFNINLTLNWRRPLFSKSLKEFWTRNHISITTWFRDYLYIGLGGNRVSYKRWLTNIFLVFLISGFWHGANFTFIIWGAMHGLLYVFELLVMQKWPRFKVPAILGHIYLLTFHTISLIAFRAHTATDLSYIYRTIFSFSSDFFSLKMMNTKQDKFYFLVIVFVITVLFLKELNEEYSLLKHHKKLYPWLKRAAYVAFILLIFLLGNFSANTFIYFQF
jgi:alginate O-acetyltransferase complex protein AlgI